MTANEKLVAKAVEILTKARFTSKTSADEAIERLFDYAPFDGMDEEDLEPIATAAVARLPGTASIVKRQDNDRRDGGGRTAAPQRRPATRKPLPVGFHPTAGYRFVALPDVVETAEPISQSRPIAGGVSAKIVVDWRAETPILIGAEKTENGEITPMALPGADNWVIPGATLRGMVRSAVEIVALARIGAVDRHLRYGLRDFDHAAYADSAVTKLSEVKAGWLTCEGGDVDRGTWFLTSIGRDWAHVPADCDLLGRGDAKRWGSLPLLEKYERVGMVRRDEPIDFRRTFDFKAPSDDKQGRPVSEPGPGRRGVFVFAGKLPGGGNKRYDYVFFDGAGAAKPIAIDAEIRSLFLRLHTKPAKNRLEPDGSWKDVIGTLKAGGRVPVFHVGDPARPDDGFFFGLTRLFKMPHRRTIGDVVAEQRAHALPALSDLRSDEERRREDPPRWSYEPDFVENLFGYVLDGKDVTFADGAPTGDPRLATDLVARKGRIAFGFARLAGPTGAMVSQPVRLILSAPRASYAPFYLRTKGGKGTKDYSSQTSPTIAGRKRYVPRWPSGTQPATVIEHMIGAGKDQMVAAGMKDKPNDKVVSTLRFLMPRKGTELRFTSEIRLHNVTPEELGAVLFALTHGGDPAKRCRHMAGRARAFGAGQLRVASARLVVTPNDRLAADLCVAPTAEEVADEQGLRGFCPAPTRDVSHGHRPFLARFEAAMKEKGEADWAATVKEFFAVSTPGTVRPTDLVSMKLKDFKELRDLVKPLRGGAPGTEGRGPESFDGVFGEGTDDDGRLMPARRPTRPG